MLRPALDGLCPSTTNERKQEHTRALHILIQQILLHKRYRVRNAVARQRTPKRRISWIGLRAQWADRKEPPMLRNVRRMLWARPQTRFETLARRVNICFLIHLLRVRKMPNSHSLAGACADFTILAMQIALSTTSTRPRSRLGKDWSCGYIARYEPYMSPGRLGLLRFAGWRTRLERNGAWCSVCIHGESSHLKRSDDKCVKTSTTGVGEHRTYMCSELVDLDRLAKEPVTAQVLEPKAFTPNTSAQWIDQMGTGAGGGREKADKRPRRRSCGRRNEITAQINC